MKPEEKAKELVDKFREYVKDLVSKEYELSYSREEETDNAKAASIICIDEIINQASGNIYTVGNNNLSNEEFWQQVKEEIKKL